MLRLARDSHIEGEVFTRLWVPNGHAVEARVYAEDPGKDSLPSSGLVTQVVFPGYGSPGEEAPAISGVRIDGFVETGFEVSALLRSDARQGGSPAARPVMQHWTCSRTHSTRAGSTASSRTSDCCAR